MKSHRLVRIAIGVALLVLGGSQLAGAVVLTNADGVIRNSLCVGFDCPNAPVFSDSTILLMENNTRIKFGDTSNSPFPNNDWEIEANSSLSGGQSYLGFNDCGTADNDGGCATDLVFAVEAGARQNALYVESDGDVGFGTSNPVVNLHVVEGNTPTLRLEQDGSSGFAPQTWDLAGNETNFFLRDVTNGSTLPFRVRPGAASSAIFIDSDSDVNIGSASNKQLGGNGGGTDVAFSVVRTNGEAAILVEEGSTSASQRFLMELRNNGAVQTKLNNTSSGVVWRFGVNNNDDFVINDEGDVGTAEVRITQAGEVFVNGAGPLAVPDYVFEPEYELMPLDELASFVATRKHLPGVANKDQVAQDGGINLTRLPLQLLEKVEELTLYTLEQQRQLQAQLGEIEALRARLAELEVAAKR